jgi:hypothetical protein
VNVNRVGEKLNAALSWLETGWTAFVSVAIGAVLVAGSVVGFGISSSIDHNAEGVQPVVAKVVRIECVGGAGQPLRLLVGFTVSGVEHSQLLDMFSANLADRDLSVGQEIDAFYSFDNDQLRIAEDGARWYRPMMSGLLLLLLGFAVRYKRLSAA